MATATCGQCGKTDFMPGLACKACGSAYDNATQARITLDENRAALKSDEGMPSENFSPGRTCLKCGNVNALANFQPLERCPVCGAIYSRVEANTAIKAVPKPSSTVGSLLTAIAILFGLNICTRDPTSAGDSPTHQTTAAAPTETCANDDARCLGIEAMDKSYSPCVRAIEGHAINAHRWTGGMLNQRFDQIAWYDPAGRVIAYTGTQLEVQNGFGVWQQRSYFCAWSLTGQLVESAGIND